ncbi:hypothetical protein COO60DRAFT_1702112 [Scenedesmus sp. NREL 46B-D3]|nr:hypothetical protein COO60DRAFT_1702112 [Scenedesmus sp. NREL 46B-D3]
MVRFHWHVEDGYGAYTPPQASKEVPGSSGVRHVSVRVDIAGDSSPMEAMFTIPAGYLHPEGGKVKDVGIVLGHGNDAEEWNGPLLSEVAATLAKAGYIVVRYHSSAKELRRQRMFEKALDVCATSPYARCVQRWVLAGIGHGARLAAIVGPRARGHVCGYVFLSYPLTDALQTAKGPVLPDSSILLLRIPAPVLFVHAGSDAKAPVNQIRTVAAQMKPEAEPRLVEVPGADSSFASGEPAALAPETVAAVAEPVLEFVSALQSGSVNSCKLPLANRSGQTAVQLSESAAAGIAAQIAILDEDDSAIYEVEPLGIVADAAAANGQQQQAVAQQLLQQHAQMQLQQALAAQQQLAAVVASKAALHLQQAAAQRAAAAAGSAAAAGALQQSFGMQLSKLPGGATSGAGGAQGSVVAPVMLSGMPAGVLTGGLTPQMLAAAQAMAAAAAKQGIRPGGGAQLVMPAGAAVAAAQQQQQQQ